MPSTFFIKIVCESCVIDFFQVYNRYDITSSSLIMIHLLSSQTVVLLTKLLGLNYLVIVSIRKKSVVLNRRGSAKLKGAQTILKLQEKKKKQKKATRDA